MITLPATISAGITAGVTTTSTLFRLTRTDGKVFGFTSHDRNISFGGVTYSAGTGYTRTAISGDSSLSSDSVDIEGVLDLSGISEEDILAGLWDHARLDMLLIDWADQSEAVTLKTGWIGEVSPGSTSFKAELMSLTSALAQNITELTSPTCRATLGDTRCTKSLAAFTFAGTVTNVTDRRVFACNLTNADNYFVGGNLTWLTGTNAGLEMEIKTSLASGAFSLFLPMSYDIAAGDTFSSVIGCNKTIATCAGTFDNGVNFQGEPYLPGTHFIVKGPA